MTHPDILILTAFYALLSLLLIMLLSSISTILISKSTGITNFSMVVKRRSQIPILFVQIMIITFQGYYSEKLMSSNLYDNIDTKYLSFIFAVCISMSIVLLIITIVNFTILLPPKSRQKIKKAIIKKLPYFLQRVGFPIYGAFKKFSVRYCDLLTDLINDLKPK